MDYRQAARAAVDNVRAEGLNDIFPRPFEVDLLQSESLSKQVEDSVAEWLNLFMENGIAKCPPMHLAHAPFPKRKPFDFRRAALIEPIDTVRFLAFVLLMAQDIENARASRDRVFSYRFQPDSDGRLFDPSIGFEQFRSAIASWKDETPEASTNVLVECDIANFYDRVNLHRLENILLCEVGLEERLPTRLNSLLSYWSRKDSYGLPVGSNASRILAEASLIPVDRYLLSYDVKFVRFMDDYALFAPDSRTAHYWLHLLIERLAKDGLSLNAWKTHVGSVRKADVDADGETGEYEDEEESSNPRMTRPRHRRKYYGGVPKEFRALTSERMEDLSDVDTEQLYSEMMERETITPDQLQLFAEAIVARKEVHLFANLPMLAGRYPQFTPYVADLLIKQAEVLPGDIRAVLRDRFAEVLADERVVPEYIALAIVRILGSPHFVDKPSLLKFFRRLGRSAGAYLGRALIDAMHPYVDRGDVLEVRECFYRADLWEQRAIIRMVTEHLPEREVRPWLDHTRMMVAGDPFGVFLSGKPPRKS